MEITYTAQNSNSDPEWVDLNQAPIFGMKVEARLYQCQIRDCGAIVKVRTNHTDAIFNSCPACSWRSGFDRLDIYYRADIQKQRPAKYIGEVNEKV